jgi:hypothetical protein
VLLARLRTEVAELDGPDAIPADAPVVRSWQLTNAAALRQDPRALVAQLDETFEKRMQQAESEVAREFGAVDPEVVHREFSRVSEDLLRNATVTDFVPVLVHRAVRESLRVRSAPTATTAGT